MKKFIFTLFLILILPIMSLAVFSQQNYKYHQTTADSGFDSDYGDYDSGGSWGGDYGGSSWDNDYDNDSSYSGSYSGGGAEVEVVLIALLITGVIAAVSFYVALKSSNTNKKIQTRKHIKNILLSNYDLQPGDGRNSEEVMKAYENYVEIQKAWMNRNLEPVRHLLTDEIYNMYQMQVETLIEDNQINVMSDFEFVCGKVDSIRTIENTETTKIILCVNCKDYLKSANKNTVISGDKKAIITYIYELTFVRDIKPTKAINCPSCGTLVKNQMSTTCPYCQNSLLLASSKTTMSNKLILHQFKII